MKKRLTKREIIERNLLEYAIKGLNKDIEDLDTKIRKGKKYIEARLKGEKIDKSPLSLEELRQKVEELEKEMAALEIMKDERKWDLQDYS